MSYMAVGSRQIHFSDSQAQASVAVSGREVSNVADNQDRPVSDRTDVREQSPAAPSETGQRVDVRA